MYSEYDGDFDVAELLGERAETCEQHGTYADVAQVSQTIKAALNSQDLRDRADAFIIEGLDMIANKQSRIACGDPTHIDHWDDIAGYATLVANELRRLQQEELEELDAEEVLAIEELEAEIEEAQERVNDYHEQHRSW